MVSAAGSGAAAAGTGTAAGDDGAGAATGDDGAAGAGSGSSAAAAGGGSGSVEERRLGRYFRLETTVAMGNMTAFGPDGRTLKRYASAADILEDYYPVRLAL